LSILFEKETANFDTIKLHFFDFFANSAVENCQISTTFFLAKVFIFLKKIAFSFSDNRFFLHFADNQSIYVNVLDN
jgi:hypothetical protein